ncbi:unnamed protein product [Closterium sp. NIES-65]|nr:unnamed protein product [Closterium sp. NIES-65]
MTSRRPPAAGRRDNKTIPESLSNKLLRSRELLQGDMNTEAAVAASVSAWGSRLPCVKEEPVPNDALTALLNAPSSTTFKTVSLYNHMGVGCQLNAHDTLTLADKKYLGGAVVDFHNIWDYGVYMCQYLEALVTSGFITVREYISFKGVSAERYRHKMCGKLCSHAEGTLIPELQRQGLRIPLQPVHVIGDNAYICVDLPMDIRRVLLDHKEKFAVIKHDIQVMTAKIEYLAIRKGVTSDELDGGARQHLGAVVDTMVPTATLRKHAKAETTADGSGQMKVVRNPPMRALAAVPSISPCHAPHTPAVKDSQVTAGNATPAMVRQQQRDHLALALRSRATTPVPAAPGNPGRVASSGQTGVMWNATKQRYYVRIISARRQQVRLGSYEDKDEASYAYAAGAVVLRPNSRISCTVELSDGDRQALAGCTEEILRLLVKYRRWNRWREWRAAMAGLDDAQPVETCSRRKGRVSRAISDVEEVEVTTQTTEDQPMAEEPEDPPEDYTDEDESVDDDAVYEPGNDDFDEEDDWEEVNRAEGDA